jgi:hypothetical protein
VREFCATVVSHTVQVLYGGSGRATGISAAENALRSSNPLLYPAEFSRESLPCEDWTRLLKQVCAQIGAEIPSWRLRNIPGALAFVLSRQGFVFLALGSRQSCEPPYMFSSFSHGPAQSGLGLSFKALVFIYGKSSLTIYAKPVLVGVLK